MNENNGFVIREIKTSDYAECCRLWSDVFGDSEKLTSFFFSLMPEIAVGAVAEAGGKIVAAAYCITDLYYINSGISKKCGYLYAVSTSENYRGRGLGSAVSILAVKLAKLSGAECIYTLPAEPELYTWYQSVLGAHPVVYCERKIVLSAPYSNAKAISAHDFINTRETYLSNVPHIKPGIKAALFEQYICKESGGDFYIIDDVPAAVSVNGTHAFVRWIPSCNAEKICAGCANFLGLDVAEYMVLTEHSSGAAYCSCIDDSIGHSFIPYPVFD